jgi:5-methylcytosine-specific restriction endonuclease McrA
MAQATIDEVPADGTDDGKPRPALGNRAGQGRLSLSCHHPSGLDSSVLVLNRLYLAVHVIGVRRAFGLLFRDLAEVVHFEEGAFANYDFQAWREMSELRAEVKQPHDDWIRTVSFEIQIPRVIRLLRYDRLPKQELHLNRRNVLARDGNRCQYCARHLPSHLLSVDHVMPRSRGGTTTWENLVCACVACNIRKGGRTPQEAKMKLVRRPFKPKRNPLLLLKLDNPKYASWKTWLDGVYWDLGARD